MRWATRVWWNGRLRWNGRLTERSPSSTEAKRKVGKTQIVAQRMNHPQVIHEHFSKLHEVLSLQDLTRRRQKYFYINKFFTTGFKLVLQTKESNDTHDKTKMTTLRIGRP